MHTYYIPAPRMTLLAEIIDRLTEARFRKERQPCLDPRSVKSFAAELSDEFGIPKDVTKGYVLGLSAQSAMRIVAQNPV